MEHDGVAIEQEPFSVPPQTVAASNGHLPDAMLSPEARFTANCAILQRVRPEILADLQRFPLVNLQLGPLACGEVGGQVWDVQGQRYIPLCHGDQPTAGAEADVESIYSREIKVFCMIGAGMGYHAVALARRLRYWQRLLILDLDPCMFKAMMYAVDIAPLFQDGQRRVDIFVGPEVMQAIEPWHMNLDAKDKTHMGFPLRSGYTAEYRRAEYDALYGKYMEMLVFHAVGLSTWRQFGQCIGDNDLLNLPEYFKSPGYEHVKDLWKDKPAVCVAAGPSLQKNLRLLFDPEIRSRVALISAGTVYAFLHGIGLSPDIVTTIDFQRLNWTDQFQYVPLDPSCTLVYLHSTYPQTPRRWPGPRFVAENASDTMNIFRPFGEGKQSAAVVQTVAHLSLLVALELGANPIVLLGQDLSMPRDSHHAAGARAQDMAPDVAPADAFLDAVDFLGRPVKTRHSFLSMKMVFERIIAQHPERTVLNCSEAGLALAGAQSVPLRDALTASLLKTYGQTLVVRTDRPQLEDVTRALADETQLARAERRDNPAIHSLLRPLLRKTWRGYAPVINPELLPTVEALQSEVATLATMARNIQAFAHEMGYATASTQHWLMQHEAVIQANSRAWGLFAIRDFRILELMAAIPPEAAFDPEPTIRDTVSCERMVAVAGYIAESAPVVARLLRLTRGRLETMGSVSNGAQQLALQHYGAMAKTPQLSFAINTQHAKYLYDTQQYDAALAIMRTWGFNPKRMARIEHHLAQWHAETRQALPAYFPCETDRHGPSA